MAAQIRFEKVANNVGTYWRSDATYRAILSHLRKMAHDGHWKAAALGGGVEEGFEQAFSSLAYAYLKDKAPRLLDFMVGFQLVDRNEDNTKAMGIFGFKVGEQWIYAPVFFLNGDLKGHELLYIKKQDSFVPMKENWVNYLMSRRPHVLGESSEQDTYALGGLSPDIYSLSTRPNVGIGKRGADLLPGGVGDGKPDSAFNAGSLARGVHEEREHTSNPAIAKEIAKDHLTEDSGAYSKSAAHIDDWAKPAMPLIASMRVQAARYLYETAKPGTKLAFDAVVANPLKAALAEVGERLDLNKILPNDFALLKTSFDIAQKFPAIKRGFDRFYGPDCFSRWATQLRAKTASVSNNIMPTMPVKQAADRPKFRGNSIIPESTLPNHPIKSGALQIRVLEHVSITQNVDDLDDDDREKLLKDTVLVKDKRDPHSGEASKAYNTQVEQKLMNPHETGLYEVLEKPGTFSRMLVISNPLSNEGQKDFCTLVRIGDGAKSWLNAHRTSLWADKVELREDFDKWFDKLGDKDSLQKGGVYLAVDQAGNGTVPFEVTESYGDGAYKVNFKAHCDYSYRRADGLGRTSTDSCNSSCCGGDYISTWGAKLYVEAEGKRGTKLRAIQGELRVPANFKFMKLKDPPKPKKDENGFLMPTPMEDSGSEDRPIQPGKLEDIQLLFTEKTAAMKVWGDHNEVTIRTKWAGDQRLTLRQALISLVGHHGFTEKTARAIIAKASGIGPTTYRVSYAPGFGDKGHLTKQAYGPNMSVLEGGPNAPPELPPETGIEMMGNRHAVRAIYPDEQRNLVPSLDSSMVDPQHQDMWQNYTFEDFQNTMGQAQQAAQQGQKEVFDTAMISGMLKSVRQDSLVDRYLGDLLKALDKLGRILFMFYWHQEEFEDRYGKQDLPELEDSLRNAFETLGDVTLFLKEKTVEPSFEAQEAEPQVEEAARI